MKRCVWAENGSELMKQYHDIEWGVPVFDDTKLFEFLILEGAQAGLSWETILNKREGYRKIFKNFDPKKVAKMTKAEESKALRDPSIVRNKLKVLSTITNAKAFLNVQKDYGSFSDYVWSFVQGKQIINRWKRISQVPSVTPLAVTISKGLKEKGFRFVGPTIIYAYMQAVGIVNDHTEDCFVAIKKT